MANNNFIDPEKDVQLKNPELTREQIEKWLSRAKMVSEIHRREIMRKYRQAKRRYNSEIGFTGLNVIRAHIRHTDINLLYKDVKEFIASIFYRNPDIDLEAIDLSDDAEVRNIENLQTIVNDDIKAQSRELKMLLRSILVDEYLSALGALYIDYDYRDRDLVDSNNQPVFIPGTQEPKRDILSNQIRITKIPPENLIRPPWIRFYNYKDAPYLGYVDIVPLGDLKNDSTLNQDVVSRIRGQEYKSLIDYESREMEKNKDEGKTDDILHARIYVIFIKGHDNQPIKKLVLVDDDNVRGEYLVYDDWDKGHGKDDRGYPIHIIELNETTDSFIPPSQAWILEPLLQIIDNIYEKINRHVRRSSTKNLVKMGMGGMEKADIEKLQRNNDMEFIGITNVPPGIDLNSIYAQIQDQPLSQDNNIMFELTRRIFDELSRQPSFAKMSIINKNKTATESEAIRQADSTENGDYIDKFKDFLEDVFYDWTKLTQRNMQGTRNIFVENRTSGQKEFRTDITTDNLQGIFRANINVNSFLPQNTILKRRMLKETIVDLTLFSSFLREQGLKVNGRRAINELLSNADVRNPHDMLTQIPIRNIDKQVTDFVYHNVPFNPGELGQNLEEALSRIMEMFADDTMMANFESIKPGVGSGKGPLAEYARILEQMIRAQKQESNVAKQKQDMITSGLHSEASILGNAQNANTL